jgi:hypothetical protein
VRIRRIDVIVIVCEPRPTAKTAGLCRCQVVPVTAWFAFSVHVPTPTRETVDPETEQTPALPAAAEKVTARPELAVAVTLYVVPTTALPGGVDVKLIVCEATPIANDCWACGAAR